MAPLGPRYVSVDSLVITAIHCHFSIYEEDYAK